MERVELGGLKAGISGTQMSQIYPLQIVTMGFWGLMFAISFAIWITIWFAPTFATRLFRPG